MFEPGEWVRVHAVEGSEVSQQASRQHAGQRGRVIVQAMLPGSDYTVHRWRTAPSYGYRRRRSRAYQ